MKNEKCNVMYKNQLKYDKIIYKKDDEMVDFLVQLQGNLSSKDPLQQVIPINLDVSVLNLFSINDGSVKLIFDHLNFKILAATDNMSNFFNVTEQNIQNFSKYMVSIVPQHLKLVAKSIQWFNSLLMEVKLKHARAYTSAFCGINILDKEGKNNRFLIHSVPYQINGQTYPAICIVTIHKINFMMKSEVAWVRITYGENLQTVGCISSHDIEGKKQDIISEREKEVLEMLAAGMDTKAIADALYISPSTIIKHRKNMLARTGLCDTTALIQVCRLCGILKN
jgi:DNA-binding CsgD family transcriptional regulator